MKYLSYEPSPVRVNLATISHIAVSSGDLKIIFSIGATVVATWKCANKKDFDTILKNIDRYTCKL